MSESNQTMRQKLHALAEELPLDASWDDVMQEIRFRKAVELGVEAADREGFATTKKCVPPLPAGALILKSITGIGPGLRICLDLRTKLRATSATMA